MKYKTTRKSVVYGSAHGCLVYSFAGELQNLLCGHEPVAYNCGPNGWNFDVFEVYGMTICTGYRNMPGRRAKNIGEYEAKARAIREDYNMRWDERINKIESLLREFCAQA